MSQYNQRQIFLGELFAVLDTVVLERIKGRKFQALGHIPKRMNFFLKGVDSGNRVFNPGDYFPFLDNFLFDAEKFWEKNSKGRLGSGLWIEGSGAEGECYFEAEAICFKRKNILLIRLLECELDNDISIIQKAREKSLLYESLVRAEKELRKARDELEMRVQERTEELSETNGLLRREIKERQKAEVKLKKSWERLKDAMDGTFHAMSSLVDIRDPNTAGHQKRVAALSRAIGEEMNLPQHQRDGIHVAASLHDIGKLYVPAEFLSRPGEVSKIELEIIRTHPIVAYDILKSIKFPWPIDKIVLQHHERMDGSGYPYGIKGEEILLEARILGLADTVEAMTAHRPYRPAMSIKEVLKEVKKGKGVHFDPKVVKACVEVFEKKKFAFEEIPSLSKSDIVI